MCPCYSRRLCQAREERKKASGSHQMHMRMEWNVRGNVYVRMDGTSRHGLQESSPQGPARVVQGRSSRVRVCSNQELFFLKRVLQGSFVRRSHLSKGSRSSEMGFPFWAVWQFRMRFM